MSPHLPRRLADDLDADLGMLLNTLGAASGFVGLVGVPVHLSAEWKPAGFG